MTPTLPKPSDYTTRSGPVTFRQPAYMRVTDDDQVLLDVLVSPKAARSRIVGLFDERVKIQVAASPNDGKANQELVKFLAAHLQVAKAQVEVVGGHSSRKKTVRVLGVPSHVIALKLTPPK